MLDPNSQIVESEPNQQIQEGFMMKNYKNLCLLLVLCLFILFFVMVFYFFIYLVYEQEETSASFQYQITQYTTNNNIITILADCVECQMHYLKTNNYVAQTLNVTIVYLSRNHLNVIMKGYNFNYQYEIPHKAPFINSKNQTTQNFSNFSSFDAYYEINAVYNPMSIVITRKFNGETIFNTSNYNLIYSRFYIEVSTMLPSKHLYGFGERNELFGLQNNVFSIWNRVIKYNSNNSSDNQSFSNSSNTYGSQPIYMMREESGFYHMVYLRNFNAMDIVFNNSDSDLSLQYRIVVFWGTIFLKRAFGLTHLISNFSSVTDLSDLIADYSNENINLEVMWLDNQYNENGNAFTLNTESFPKKSMQALLNTTKIVANIGPCIKADTSSEAYSTGKTDEIFLKGITGEIISGYNKKVGTCNYPDFFNQDTSDYWTTMLTDLYTSFNFSGIWLDDNEIYDQAAKSAYPANISLYENYVNYSDLPYFTRSFPLDVNTIDLNAVHDENTKEFDVHSLYAILESYATFTFLNETKKNPFVYIMTVANSVGFSSFAGHFQEWLPFDWSSLKYYLSNMLNYNLFGAPFMGTIICSGINTTNSSEDDRELCARWVQLATFSPLFLVKSQTQEENIFLKSDLLTVFQTSLKLRNSLIPHIYTILLDSLGNCTLLQPLFFSFPNDTNTFNLSNVTNTQFIVGNSLMVAPILEQSTNNRSVYFPSANWYEFFNCTQILNSSQSGQFIQINNSISDSAPVYIQGGKIVSRASTNSLLNLSNSDLIFHIALEKNSSGYYIAEGKILGFKNVYNDTNLYESCFATNCLVTVRAEAIVNTTATQTHYQIKLSFSAETAQTLNIYLTSAEFYGLNLKKCVSFNLGTSYQVKVPNSFTMNIYE